MAKYSIIFIGQTTLLPLIAQISEPLGELLPETSSHVFSKPKEGMEFVLNNLQTKMIVISECKFKGSKIKGMDIYHDIRNRNGLVSVILLYTSSHRSELKPEDIKEIGQDNHAYSVDMYFGLELTRIKLTHIIARIKAEWKSSFDYTLEEWLSNNPDLWPKTLYSDAERVYTWGDVLREVRMQSKGGNALVKLVSTCLIKYREQHKIDPTAASTSSTFVIKIPIED